MYSNPLVSLSGGQPSVIRHQGIYYLYVREEAYGGRRLIRVFTSSNLVYWQRGPEVLRAPVGRDCAAPDVWRDPDSGRFYLYHTLDPASHGVICVADADGPLGPFQTRRQLVDQAHDPHLYSDAAGGLFLFYSQRPDRCLVVQPLLNALDLQGEPRVILSPESEWETRGFPSLNDPCIVNRAGRYYLLYAGSNPDSSDSAIGYATADHPLGPYTRAVHNPILRRSMAVYGPNAPCAIRDSADQWWLVYHQKSADAEAHHRIICLDLLRFDDAGRLFGRATRATCEKAPVAGSKAP
jgi:beta-xylosidase